MYGLTECKRVSYLPPEEIDRKPASVGVPIPGTQAYVVDDNGNPLPPGATGELVVRGPHVMLGYWNDAATTAEKIKPGRFPWERVLYTGDLFRQDEDGYLYFVARKDDLIKCRGERIAPKEIEEVLLRLAGVAQAAVIGVPDPVLGNALHAHLELNVGAKLTPQDVLTHCRKHLEDFRVPQVVEFVSALPRSANGKIDRKALMAEQVMAVR
jgi:acyl-CoA synthetase (AMP-forming)/AMP-acid ligase II